MNYETFMLFVAIFLWAVGMLLGSFIGSKITKRNIKKILHDVAKNPSTEPRRAVAYMDMLLNNFGEHHLELDFQKNRLFVQLYHDGEAYFKAEKFETSMKLLEEAVNSASTQEQTADALTFKCRAEAMVKFERVQFWLNNLDIDPAKTLILLEEAKTLAGDYKIPGYAELKTKVLAKINEVHGEVKKIPG